MFCLFGQKLPSMIQVGRPLLKNMPFRFVPNTLPRLAPPDEPSRPFHTSIVSMLTFPFPLFPRSIFEDAAVGSDPSQFFSGQLALGITDRHERAGKFGDQLCQQAISCILPEKISAALHLQPYKILRSEEHTSELQSQSNL